MTRVACRALHAFVSAFAFALVFTFAMSACRPSLPFGAPCGTSADCDDGFVCEREACVPSEGGAGEGEGEGEGDEGEGEGEGENIPGVAHVDVTGDVGRVQASAMDARDDFVAVVDMQEFDDLHGTYRLDFHARSGDADVDVDGIVPDVGTFAHWASLALDADHTSWICFTQPNADNTGAVVELMAVDAAGAVQVAPRVLDDSGTSSPRCDVAVDGIVVGVAVRSSSGVSFASSVDDFVVRAVDGTDGGFSENELQRVALAFDGNHQAHVVVQSHNNVVHAFQTGGNVFDGLDNVDSGDSDGTYVSAAFDASGNLVVAYDIEISFNLAQCVSTWNGATWSLCAQVPVDFNTHSDALTFATDGSLAVAYVDATTESPVLARGAPGDFETFHLDADGVTPSFTTAAVRADGKIVVAYSVDKGSERGAVKLAIVDP